MTAGTRVVLAVTIAAVSVFSGSVVAQVTRENPLLSESRLPYQAPAFDTIRDTDYEPALLQGMAEQRVEVQQIIDNPQPPTFQNTIEALERSGAPLNRVSRVFNALVQANTDPALQKTDVAMAPRLASHRDETVLNPALFARIERIYEERASLQLTPEQQRLVQRYYRDYTRAGAALNDAQKEQLRALNKEQSELVTAFRNKVLAGVNAASPVFNSVAALDGLSPDDIAAAATAASVRSMKDRWVLPLQNTTQQPSMTYLKDRAVRERIFKASISRNADGENDTTGVVTRLAQLRAQRAALLGYATHAAFTLDNQMAKTPDAALKLMTDMVPPVMARTKAEASRIQQLIDAQKGGFTLEPWDWQYYAEQVRKADYAFDESQVRPYFELDRVLRDGVFFAATEMYGVTFKERKDLPVYHPDVRVFEVFDKDGSGLGLFYADYFARPSKRGGAWTNSLVGQSKLLGTAKVEMLILIQTSASLFSDNYDESTTRRMSAAAAGVPAITSADAVGRALHALGAKRIALVSPYSEDVNARARRYYSGKHGLDIALLEGFAAKDSYSIGKLGPENARDAFVRIDRPDIDAFVVPGANFLTMASISEWEREFKKPVVSSTQAAVWAMARQLGGERISGFGRLLEQMPAQ